MKTIIKVVAVLFILVLIIAGAGVGYLLFALPNVGPASGDKVETTPQRLARGEYLANNVMSCMDCHSKRDWAKFAGPMLPGTEGEGGEEWVGEFGKLVATNITPTELGSWTDGEIIRVTASGVNKAGEPIFPLMPYLHYNRASQEDLDSLVVYLRTLQPKKNIPPKSQLAFPFTLLVRTMPIFYQPKPQPDTRDKIAYGKYLASIGGCEECHTPMKNGAPLPGMEFAGGFEFPLPTGGIVRSTNLTPDPESGMGGMTRDEFVQAFKKYLDPETQTPVGKGDFNTVMPWTFMAKITEEDLDAIYAFLMQLKPVKNQVEVFSQ